MFTDKEKRLLLELISNEQIHMIIKDHTKYESDKYRMLERLKVIIKDSNTVLKGEIKCTLLKEMDR
jgi:hypothetical protein